MTLMVNNQRKMTRRLRPTSGGMHDVTPARGQHTSPGNSTLKRAAKKQIKTREERAWPEDAA